MDGLVIPILGLVLGGGGISTVVTLLINNLRNNIVDARADKEAAVETTRAIQRERDEVWERLVAEQLAHLQTREQMGTEISELKNQVLKLSAQVDAMRIEIADLKGGGH